MVRFIFVFFCDLNVFFVIDCCDGTEFLAGRKRWRHVRKVTTRVLIVNLAVSDLLVSVIGMPVELAQEITGRWMLGRAFCKIHEYLQAVGFAVNVLSVTFIALDRYLMLAKPFTWKQHSRVVKYIVRYCWGFSIILCSPYFYIYDVVELGQSENQVCSVISPRYKWLEQLYWALQIYYLYILPFIIISFCYVGILKYITRMKRVDKTPGTKSSQKKYWYRIKIRSSYLAIAVVTVFYVCWLPSLVVVCLRIHHGSVSVGRMSVPYDVALFMAYANEAINPILYGYLDSYFKKHLRSSLQCFSCVDHVQNSRTETLEE